MSKNKATKILVPILMLAIVLGIWLVKNQEQEAPRITGEFALAAKSVDLEQLKTHNLPMIIDFGADECVPCKEMAPVLIELNEEMQGLAIIKFVDVWKNPEAANNFPVQVIPTQIIINADGSPYIPSKDFGVQFLMYSGKETGEHIFTAHQGGLNKEQMRLILQDMGVN